MSDTPDGQPAPTSTPAIEANKRRRAVNVSRLSLYAPAPTGDGKKEANLAWSVFEGNPRVVVYTEDPNEKENKDKSFGRIQVALDPGDVGVLMVYIKRAIAAEPNFKLGLKNFNSYNYLTNERFENGHSHINDLVVGKDADGIVYIAAVEKDRPAIRFYFGPSKYHQPVKGDGTEFTKQELSIIYAESWIIMVPEVIAALVAADAIDRSNNPEEQAKWSGAPKREWNNNRQGGGGGNWNRGGGGGNWNNRGGGGGGGGYNRGGGGGGNWNRGGGGGGYNGGGNRGNYGGGGGGNSGGGAPAGGGGGDIADSDIQF